jgi:uncharacterized protein YqhQ
LSSLKVGGQAFADGVLMRSKRFWAIAHEDGTTEFGRVYSWLEHHPKWNVFLIRSIISFVEMAKFGFKTYERSAGLVVKRFITWTLIYVAAALFMSMLVKQWFGDGHLASLFLQFFYLAMALFAISQGMSGRIWTYHGAEHKAVNAYESGHDLDDLDAMKGCSRIHQRCGTNLMFMILIAAAFYVPNPNMGLNVLLSALYMVFMMAISLELFRQLTRWPQHLITKIFLLGGNTLQRFATTKEPDDDQLLVAAKALKLVLALEEGNSRSR